MEVTLWRNLKVGDFVEVTHCLVSAPSASLRRTNSPSARFSDGSKKSTVFPLTEESELLKEYTVC